MTLNIKNTEIYYERIGIKEGKKVILLHGWGQNIEMMKPVVTKFQKEFDIFLLDLPGHGHSAEPLYDWSVDDFVEMLHEFINYFSIENPILIGHSFGGKICLLYASRYQVEKMILFASPYKKEVQKLSTKTKILKKLKKMPGMEKIGDMAKKYIGSDDYRNATPIMRKILVNTVNYDIEDEIKNISCPTVLIWGTNDEAVSIERAYQLEKILSDAGLIVYEGCTHYAYLERLNQTISIVGNFIRS